jgi:hypothetical protein
MFMKTLITVLMPSKGLIQGPQVPMLLVVQPRARRLASLETSAMLRLSMLKLYSVHALFFARDSLVHRVF